MNKDKFVKEIKKYNPSRDELKRFNLSEALIERELIKYNCIQREETLGDFLVDSEVLRLVNCYDCSKVEIGVLSFLNSIAETEEHYLIGMVEADTLAVNKITLEVQVLDYTNLDWVIWSCAANGELFLDALLLSVEYFSNMIENPDLSSDITATYVLRCSEKAGGEKYFDFYKMLLGLYE